MFAVLCDKTIIMFFFDIDKGNRSSVRVSIFLLFLLTVLSASGYNKANFERRCESWTFTYVTEKVKAEVARLASLFNPFPFFDLSEDGKI